MAFEFKLGITNTENSFVQTAYIQEPGDILGLPVRIEGGDGEVAGIRVADTAGGTFDGVGLYPGDDPNHVSVCYSGVVTAKQDGSIEEQGRQRIGTTADGLFTSVEEGGREVTVFGVFDNMVIFLF